MSLKKLIKSSLSTSKPLRIDYSFNQWQALSSDARRDVINSWDPYHPEIGKSTRDAILEAFRLEYPELSKISLGIGYSYFGWMVGCIYIVVPKSSIKVPKEFASLYVNKGYVYKKIDKEVVLVNWRYGGTKSEFKLARK
jgi:hypothetical protein